MRWRGWREEVYHPKGNTTQTQTCQLSHEGQTRVVLAFNPTQGGFEAKGSSRVEDFEGATME